MTAPTSTSETLLTVSPLMASESAAPTRYPRMTRTRVPMVIAPFMSLPPPKLSGPHASRLRGPHDPRRPLAWSLAPHWASALPAPRGAANSEHASRQQQEGAGLGGVSRRLALRGEKPRPLRNEEELFAAGGGGSKGRREHAAPGQARDIERHQPRV